MKVYNKFRRLNGRGDGDCGGYGAFQMKRHSLTLNAEISKEQKSKVVKVGRYD